MASPAQINANRANARNSTGPRSEAGKAAASRNASTHGLASSAVILAGEDPAEFDQLLATYLDDFAPETEHQHFLVRQMVEARWRLDRIRRVETAVFNQMLTGSFGSDQAARIAQAMQQRGDAQARLERYATTAERAYYRAHRELVADQKQQRRDESAAMEAALEAYIMAPPPIRSQPVLQNEPNSAAAPRPVRSIDPPIVSMASADLAGPAAQLSDTR